MFSDRFLVLHGVGEGGSYIPFLGWYFRPCYMICNVSPSLFSAEKRKGRSKEQGMVKKSDGELSSL